MKQEVREVRRMLRDRVIGCSKCELRQLAKAPVPFFGPMPADIVVVGEAPGSQENKEGVPFVGPSGSLLKDTMRKVGLDPSKMLWINSVACFPNGTPKQEHLDACKGNRWEPLTLAEPTSILVIGSVALSTFRPDLKLTNIHGRPLHWAYGDQIDGRVQHWTARVILYPTYHPAAALRNPQIKALMTEDLRKFKVFHEMGFHHAWPMDCVICGDTDPEHVDKMGVHWCRKHWERQLSLFGRKAQTP